MNSRPILLTAIASLLLAACATQSSMSRSLKNVDEVPEAVRAIESVIDRGGCIKAEVVSIYVSRNYEWDVSLTGNSVSVQKHVGEGEHESIATGHPRAMFRNLEIHAYQKITFRKSGFDVVPFIRITARGGAVFIEKGSQAGQPFKVHNADSIVVNNADIRFIGKKAGVTSLGTGGGAGGADAKPAGRVRRP